MAKIITRVSEDPIIASEVMSWLPDSSHGAGNVFFGYVRDINLGKKVTAIEYDCFIPLAEKTFKEIAQEACQRWGDETNILVVHRHGRLNVGDISVVIYATTRHRDESYLVSRYIIENIKTRAPIWKKEIYENGETDWVRGHALCQHSKVNFQEVRTDGHQGNHSCGREIHSHGHR